MVFCGRGLSIEGLLYKHTCSRGRNITHCPPPRKICSIQPCHIHECRHSVWKVTKATESQVCYHLPWCIYNITVCILYTIPEWVHQHAEFPPANGSSSSGPWPGTTCTQRHIPQNVNKVILLVLRLEIKFVHTYNYDKHVVEEMDCFYKWVTQCF